VSGGDLVAGEELGAKCLFRPVATSASATMARVALITWSSHPIAKGLGW
jgi:hypothetical protein